MVTIPHRTHRRPDNRTMVGRFQDDGRGVTHGVRLGSKKQGIAAERRVTGARFRECLRRPVGTRGREKQGA